MNCFIIVISIIIVIVGINTYVFLPLSSANVTSNIGVLIANVIEIIDFSGTIIATATVTSKSNYLSKVLSE